jgi:hypothetical protein
MENNQDLIKELITLLANDRWLEEDINEISEIATRAYNDPEAYIDSDEGAEMAWLLEVDPEGIPAWVIFNELFDVFVVCDKIDELHEQIQEVFPEAPIPDFPYGQFPATPDYFIWLDKLLKGTPPGYQLISFGDSYGDNLQGLIISRADTERVMHLCKTLNIKASKSMLD